MKSLLAPSGALVVIMVYYIQPSFFKFFRLTNESEDNILLWDSLSANEEGDNKILIVQRVYN